CVSGLAELSQPTTVVLAYAHHARDHRGARRRQQQATRDDRVRRIAPSRFVLGEAAVAQRVAVAVEVGDPGLETGADRSVEIGPYARRHDVAPVGPHATDDPIRAVLGQRDVIAIHRPGLGAGLDVVLLDPRCTSWWWR